MDKISSMLSSSKKHVDMSKERPVRAGAPSYGQPVSPATHTFEKVQKEDELMNQKVAVQEKISSPSDLRHMGMIDKITFSFKGNSEREPVVEEEAPVLNTLPSEESSETEAQPQPLDLYA